jgi:soluble lytic murein transglycosylase-like protein
MTLFQLRFSFLSMALAIWSGAAHADLYGFVDGGRVSAMYSDRQPEDSRYTLFRKDLHGASTPLPDAAPRNVVLPPSRFSRHIQAASKATRVDAALIHAVITVESGYNPSARSRAGAVGLMQLMPETASRYGVKNRLDPEQNIHAGARHLRDLKVQFGDNLPLVLAAYNAGAGAVMKYGRRIPPYAETIAYVPKVLGHYRKLLAAS